MQLATIAVKNFPVELGLSFGSIVKIKRLFTSDKKIKRAIIISICGSNKEQEWDVKQSGLYFPNHPKGYNQPCFR